MKISPNNITELKDNEIFVFGSNLAGKHGRGAAKIANDKFGAKRGHGTGRSGKSYGIATKDENLNILPLCRIEEQIVKFLRYAAWHLELDFLVTKIGCGLAGYGVEDIAPLFGKHTIPPNVFLPIEFYDWIKANKNEQ